MEVNSDVKTIDCRAMTDRAAAHAHLRWALGLPTYYGANLDALYDCLWELPPCRIRVLHEGALAQLGDYGAALLQTLRDAAQDSGRIELSFEE